MNINGVATIGANNSQAGGSSNNLNVSVSRSQMDDASKDKNIAGQERCYHCGQPGHLFAECPYHTEGLSVSRDSCFRCGRKGHTARDCSYQDTRICFVCGQKGHISTECDKKKLKPPVGAGNANNGSNYTYIGSGNAARDGLNENNRDSYKRDRRRQQQDASWEKWKGNKQEDNNIGEPN
ncbi:MAG: hypothetical protein EZS28_051007, partial [Streblomastix strix]